MSPSVAWPAARDDAQLSAHPYPIGPGAPALACCCASAASYVRVKPSAGPKPGTDKSLPDWVKSPLSVSTGSPAIACRTPGAAGFAPPEAAPAGTSPPADGASACVPALAGTPASTYGCPVAPSEAVKSAGAAPARYATPDTAVGHPVNDSCTEHAGDAHDARLLLASPLNAFSASASSVLAVPESGHPAPRPVTLNPPPSTPASSGTAVPAAAVEYAQFSDTYNPVPDPATAYPTASDSSPAPALPASAVAVPSTATFPVTAAPHVAAVDTASDGTPDAHVPPLLGSPMMIAEYAPNCAVVSASHCAGVSTVTVAPAAVAAAASELDSPPFTLVDKISTDPDDARAGAAPTAIPGAATATAADAVNTTGTTDDPAASTGPSTPATSRRSRRPARLNSARRAEAPAPDRLDPRQPAPSPRTQPISHPSPPGPRAAPWAGITPPAAPRRYANRRPIHIP